MDFSYDSSSQNGESEKDTNDEDEMLDMSDYDSDASCEEEVTNNVIIPKLPIKLQQNLKEYFTLSQTVCISRKDYLDHIID